MLRSSDVRGFSRAISLSSQLCVNLSLWLESVLSIDPR